MDRKAQNIMMMSWMYQTHAQMETGQGLLSIAGSVETEEQNISLYLDQSEEWLLRISKNERILAEYEGPVPAAKIQKEKMKKDTSNGKKNSSMVNL